VWAAPEVVPTPSAKGGEELTEPENATVVQEDAEPRRIKLSEIPWWAVIIGVLGAYVIYSVATSPAYLDVLDFVMEGVKLTLQTTAMAFSLALVLGLLGGLGRVSKNPILYAIATLYVEIIRGLPMLVIILYMGFVVGPWIRDSTGFNPPMLQRAIAGLGFGYGAYLTEVYRAGIQSIHRGQMEAARSLGMTYFQSMRHVVLPQAFRIILPPLVNDLSALLKDTSLISVIALSDLLQRGRLYASRTFRAFEPYNTVALLYLAMTLTLSSLSRLLERRMRIGEH
jgi:polar amino acid transport system permease protein